MYQLCFYVPTDACERVKQAVFEAGAGRVGDYECCSWQVLGQGQFKPKPGAKPFVGELDQLEQLAEYRVEMVCASERVKAVIEALKLAHPYEEPAYHAIKISIF